MLTQTQPAAMTVSEASSYLGISRASIYRLFLSGELTRAKVGKRTLIRRADADALLERAAVEACVTQARA